MEDFASLLVGLLCCFMEEDCFLDTEGRPAIDFALNFLLFVSAFVPEPNNITRTTIKPITSFCDIMIISAGDDKYL
jgi:hypothetical protein